MIDQNFYYLGLKYTGPTFACAMSNILPAMTFVMAVIFRYSSIHTTTVAQKNKIRTTTYQVCMYMVHARMHGYDNRKR